MANEQKTTAGAGAAAPVVQNPILNDKGVCSYNVAGEEVKLSYGIVKNFLTRGNNDKVTDQDLVQFISICKYNQLNPFLNEAYLVKFGDNPAQMIVSKEALLKRAEACETYEGIQGGIIVLRDGEVVELEGCFYLPSDQLIGGWAKVYRSDKKYPYVAKVNLSEYDKKQSLWKDKPSTMVSKVAKVQALREAFPTQLGAMYTIEEQGLGELTPYEDVSKKVEREKQASANKEPIRIDADEVPVQQPTQAANGSAPSNDGLFGAQGQQAKTPGF